MTDYRSLALDPFRKFPGAKGLMVGLAFMAAAALVGALSRTHMDGVLDTHTGIFTPPLWFYLAEVVIDWLAAALLFFLGGMALGRGRADPVAVIETQALARAPMLLAVLPPLLPGFRRYADSLAAGVLGNAPGTHPGLADAVVFWLGMAVILAAAIWMVALMWKGFSLCFKAKGARAVIVFIVALVLAEAVSKAAIGLLVRRISAIPGF